MRETLKSLRYSLLALLASLLVGALIIVITDIDALKSGDFAKGGGQGLIPFFGARASGGPVNAGGAYLVGERGPEMFAPRQGGTVSNAAVGAVSVHFHLGPGADAGAIARHQGQIAASIARAVAYGRRNL